MAFGVTSFSESPFVTLGGSVTAALNGVVATGVIGAVGRVVSTTMTGVSLEGYTGIPIASSVYATGYVGTPMPMVRVALTGSGGIGLVGRPGVHRNNPVPGVATAAVAGSVDYFNWSLIDDDESPDWQPVDMMV